MASTGTLLVGGETLPGIPLVVMGGVEGGVVGLRIVIVTPQSKVVGTSTSSLTSEIVHPTVIDLRLVKYLCLVGVEMLIRVTQVVVAGVVDLGRAVVCAAQPDLQALQAGLRARGWPAFSWVPGHKEPIIMP